MFKMGYRPKQRILNRGLSKLKEMFDILSHQGNANENNSEFHFIPIRMAKIKDTSNSSCWQGCEGRETLLHRWWEWKLVQPHWKSIWQFLRKLGVNLPQDPAIPQLGIYPKDTLLYHKDTCSTMFIAALLIIARNRNNLDVPQPKNG